MCRIWVGGFEGDVTVGDHSVHHRIISFGRNLWPNVPHTHGYAFKSASFHLRGIADMELTCSDPLLALARGEPTEMVIQ